MPKPAKPETVLIQFRQDAEIVKVWDALAAKRGMKRNEWIKFMCSGKGGEAQTAPAPKPSPSFSHDRSKTVVAPANREMTRVEPVHTSDQTGRTVHLGPPPYAPGSLAKRPKGPK